MAIIDITESFLSILQPIAISYSPSWNSSTLLKSSNAALHQMFTFQQKIIQLKKFVSSSSRFDKEKNNRMIQNIRENIKHKEQMIKKLALLGVDVKGDQQLGSRFKQAIITALEMRLLIATFQFKELYLQNSLKGKSSVITKGKSSMSNQRKGNKAPGEQSTSGINLSRSYFLQQSAQEILQENCINEYKQIQKSIGQIFSMYQQSLSVTKMGELLIDTIENNVGEIDHNVGEGKKNMAEIQRRQGKNRSLIVKMFLTLYILTFLYIVFLS